MVSAASAAASEELAAGAGVAHGAERAGEGRPGGGVVVLGGSDGPARLGGGCGGPVEAHEWHGERVRLLSAQVLHMALRVFGFLAKLMGRTTLRESTIVRSAAASSRSDSLTQGAVEGGRVAMHCAREGPPSAASPLPTGPSSLPGYAIAALRSQSSR